MQRSLLVKIVAALFSALFIAFLMVLFTSLNSGSENNAGEQQNEFSDLAAGETGKRRYQRHSVWVTHLSESQKLVLAEPATHLVDNGGCTVSQYCLLKAATERDGIEISYSFMRPPQVPSDVPWQGGFVNPLSGAVYDLLGRAYKLNQAEYQQALPTLAYKAN